MKYDQDGILCGFDDFEHIPGFMEPEDASEYFQRMTDEIPWQEVTWRTGRPLPRLVFRYGEFERQFRTYEVLEELIAYIEAVLETDVLSVWCNLYRNGEDYTPYHQDNYDAHAVTMSFGATRKFSIRKAGKAKTRKDYHLSNGDLFYFTPEINKEYEHTIPKTKRVKEARISVVFFTDEPYSHRKRHFRHINLLGFGRIPVWFEGPESQFPEDAVATILPMPVGESYGPVGGNNPPSFPLASTRPDFGSFVDVDTLPEPILQGLMQAIMGGGSSEEDEGDG